jgi:hypothetical protein
MFGGLIEMFFFHLLAISACCGNIQSRLVELNWKAIKSMIHPRELLDGAHGPGRDLNPNSRYLLGKFVHYPN